MSRTDMLDDAAEIDVTEPSTSTSTDTDATDEPTEVSTDAATPEATDTDATSTDAAPAEPVAVEPEKAAPVKIDVAAEVTAFMATLDADGGAIKTADATNGQVSEEALAAIGTVYAALPNAAVKRAALAAVSEAMVTTLSDKMDPITARAYSLVKKSLDGVQAIKVTAVKEPVDPTEAFVASATALYLGTTFLTVPDGLTADWQALVTAKAQELAKADVPNYLAYLATKKAWDALPDADKAATVTKDGQETFVNPEPVAPKVDQIVVRAAHLARGKASAPKAAKSGDGTPKAPRAATGASYDGPKRSITAHIADYFADKAVGTFAKIAEIRAHKSAEYPDGDASQGAISAALFADGAPKDVSAKLPGIVGDEVDGRKGARKTA